MLDLEESILMDEDLKEYRSSLLQTIQKLNESYDKLIITLSGGALGLSIVFFEGYYQGESNSIPKSADCCLDIFHTESYICPVVFAFRYRCKQKGC